jgi:hypothetical protein
MIKYTVICFNEENKKLVESNYAECYNIIKRDLKWSLRLDYKIMDKPDILKIDENNDGIYDLRKTSESDIALRNWGIEQIKLGNIPKSSIIMNPETRSGVSGVGTYWKPSLDLLIVGCFGNKNNILHCFLHEIGHSLGAKHTSNNLDSIMCYGKIETYEYHKSSIEQIINCKNKYI